MKDKEKIIEFLIKKYGYESLRKRGYVKPRYPSTFNKRIRKSIEHFLLFYDEEKDKLKTTASQYEKYQSWVYDFVIKYNLEKEYKKECLKELLIH